MDGANKERAKGSMFNSRVVQWLALALIIVAAASVRFRLRDMPLERDEGEYAYAGQLMLEGIPPYELAYNMKFPGTYAAYALVMGMFGQTPGGIRVGLILINSVTTLLVFLLARRMKDGTAGAVAAGVFAYGTLCASSFGLAAHATHFVILPALGGLLLMLRAVEKRSNAGMFGSGVLFGLALLMKQPGAVFAMFAAAYLYYVHRSGNGAWKSFLKQEAMLGLGTLTPLFVTALWLMRAGVLERFWFWTIEYAHKYATETAGGAAVLTNLRYVPLVVYVTLVLSLVGVVVLWRSKDSNRTVFVAGLLAASVVGVMPGLHFRGHYFIVLLPVLGCLTGVVVSAARDWLSAYPRPVAYLPIVAVVAALVWGVVGERALFFRDTPVEASRRLYGPTNPFAESVVIAEYLKAHATKGARVAVLGSEPEIYFYSRLHSATGYIYTYALMEPQPYASKMQKEMTAEIEASRPEYMVWVQSAASWLSGPGSDLSILTWIDRYCEANYEQVGLVDMYLGGTDIFWDAEAKNRAPASKYHLCVYKRKEGK